MVHKVGMQFEDFKFIIARLRTDPRYSSPSWEFVKECERTIHTSLQVFRGTQAETTMESTGFVAQVATTSSQNSTPMAKSQPDQPPRRIERTQEDLKELRGKIFCRYGLSCRGSKDGTCEFNHDPNHPKWKTHPLNPGATPSKDFPPPPVPKWDFNRCKQLGI